MSTLESFEWKFGVTASSEELKDVGSSFVQLKLQLRTGSESETVYLELTLPQFYKMLHELQRAQACLQ